MIQARLTFNRRGTETPEVKLMPSGHSARRADSRSPAPSASPFYLLSKSWTLLFKMRLTECKSSSAPKFCLGVGVGGWEGEYWEREWGWGLRRLEEPSVFHNRLLASYKCPGSRTSEIRLGVLTAPPMPC